MILLSCRCSMMCADQPLTRAMTNSGVNISVGTPAGDKTPPRTSRGWGTSFGVAHHAFQPIGDVIQLHRPRFLRQAQRDLFDHLMARIGDGVHWVPEANHHLFVVDAAANVGFRFFRRFIALLDLQRHLVGAAVLRPRSAPMAPTIAE